MKIFALIIAALMTMGLLSPLPASAADDAPVTVFVVAHQDDELLGMGSSIRQHSEAGHHVVVVLATDGAATNARAKLEKRHGISLTAEEITYYRDREWRLSSRRLGATEWRIAPEGLRMPDRGVTPEGADNLYDWVMQRWPDARVKSHSYLAPLHPDHRELGAGLLRAYDNGKITDARFHLSITERALMDRLPVMSKVTRDVGDSEQQSYRTFSPETGWYSLGYISTGPTFEKHRADPSSWVHKPYAPWK